MANTHYSSHHFDFAAGDQLLIYTDGLTEAENKKGEAYGEERLRQHLSQNCQSGAREHIESLVNEIKAFTHGCQPFDDITLLCLCRRDQAHQNSQKTGQDSTAETTPLLGKPHQNSQKAGQDHRVLGQWSIEPRSQAAAQLLSELQATCARHGLDEETSHDVCLATDELVSNSRRHAGHREAGTQITVVLKQSQSNIQLIYRQSGAPFDIRKSKKPQTDLPWQQRKPGGLGLYLIKQLFDDIDYDYRQGCNILTLNKTTSRP